MQTQSNIDRPCLCGLITDQDLDAAEVEFPGITRFHVACAGRYRTFLELVHAYLMGDVAVAA